jgi:hydroxyethylthiazole kinase-like uncharacterized protein yjeF
MRPSHGSGDVKPITRALARSLLPRRPEESNKATFGNVLNVAGSVNYRGAACLSSLASLRVGAGYSTLACPEAVANSAASLTPDIVTLPLKIHDGGIDRTEYKKILEVSHRYRVLVVGCGLFSLHGDNENTKAFFASLMAAIIDFDLTVVIDADGLNMLSGLQPIDLPKNAILTPHPKELSRLLKLDTDIIQNDRALYAKLAAERFGATVVLKGHETIVSDGKSIFVNTTGNSALAKAGTGDVLTGTIAGFAAQGLSPLDAACLGVYLHGKAGEIASRELTEYGVLASDLGGYLPRAIRTLL